MTYAEGRASWRLSRSIVMALVIGGIGSVSLAQFGGSGGSGGMRRGRGTETPAARNNDTGASSPARAQQVTGVLFDLRVRLLITAEQEPAWERFYSGFVQWAAAAPESLSLADQQPALQAMESQLSVVQKRFALTESLTDALKNLYSILGPEQRRAADQVIPHVLSELAPSASGRSPNRSRNP
jgi:hypothetical protein